MFVLHNRAVGLKSSPSLAEHVHPDLASSAKLVSRDASWCGWVMKRDAGSVTSGPLPEKTYD